jgi:multidrug efflux system membrane fusion protein
LGALLGGLLMLGGCAPKPAKSEGMQMEFRVPVTVAKATMKNVPVQVEIIGNVEAYSNVSVRTQMAGEIEKAYFTQGQDVKKGQLLFTLDRRPFEATLNQLEANLARDQAQLANARAQAERNEKLFQSGIISKDQYDTFRTTAQAQEATVRAGQAAIENAKINLSYCSVYSPIDGRTGSYQVYPGNIAKVNDTVLVVINQIHPIYVTFSVPEQYLSEVKEYQARGPLAVEARIPNDPGPPSTGQLTFIDNAVDATTGTIKMRATFPNSDNRLWPGQFVNVVLRLAVQPNATVVPSQAVQTGPMGKYLFVVEPDAKGDLKGNLRPVIVGTSVEGETVIEKGVAPGDTVVTDGQLLLAPGSKVEIKKGSG